MVALTSFPVCPIDASEGHIWVEDTAEVRLDSCLLAGVPWQMGR